MDNPLTPENRDRVIEEALSTYPMAAMPRDITGDVMKRIQAVPPPQALRLTWRDLALSLTIALCLGALWLSLQQLPPIVVAMIRKESILFYQHLLVDARWLVPVVSFSLAGFLAALTIPYLRQELRRGSS